MDKYDYEEFMNEVKEIVNGRFHDLAYDRLHLEDLAMNDKIARLKVKRMIAEIEFAQGVLDGIIDEIDHIDLRRRRGEAE